MLPSKHQDVAAAEQSKDLGIHEKQVGLCRARQTHGGSLYFSTRGDQVWSVMGLTEGLASGKMRWMAPSFTCPLALLSLCLFQSVFLYPVEGVGGAETGESTDFLDSDPGKSFFVLNKTMSFLMGEWVLQLR